MPLELNTVQVQEQKLVQQQRLTALQILQIHMLEMPLAQIEQAVKSELCDNPALEAEYQEPEYSEEAYEPDENGDSADEQERLDREDALDQALDAMGLDDRDESMEGDYKTRSNNADPDADQEEMIYGDVQSFYDKLIEQVNDEDLNDRQRGIVEYIVGSLDNDGLLRKDIISIADELAIYNNLDCTEEEILQALKVVQGFDPAGVGGRTLQECLLLQIARREPSEMRHLMALVVAHHFEEFTKKHWEKLGSRLHITPEKTQRVISELRKLNPRPGSAFGETMGRNTQQVTPDFIVETAFDGTVTFQLNQGNMPQLHISQDFMEQMQGYQQNKSSLNKHEKEGLLYIKEKVERARGYIEAVQKRHRTMEKTMQAIIDIQKKYFQDGDESDLVPMTLKDVADRIDMDISTVSRVCNGKYADTRWGIFKLRHFFTDGYNISGTNEELSTRRIKLALKDIIAAEDKQKPLSDEALAKELKRQGYPIARRTVAKYREQLGLPVARLRK